jgi:hypothetical protein
VLTRNESTPPPNSTGTKVDQSTHPVGHQNFKTALPTCSRARCSLSFWGLQHAVLLEVLTEVVSDFQRGHVLTGKPVTN